jgi:multiple sugar transport system ATP-binding protein
VRPEHLALAPAGAAAGAVEGTLALVEYLGDVMLAYVQVEGVEGMVAAKLAAADAVPPTGARVALRIDMARVHLFDTAGIALRPG